MASDENLRLTPSGWYLNDEPILNLAAIVPTTKVLGPGNRFGIWVQGCNRRCKGCLAKEWLKITPANLISIPKLCEVILNTPDIQGLTISGGEPMLQAAGLLRLVDEVKNKKNMDIICYTGYTLDQLIQQPPSREVLDFLKMIDVLIDGEYLEDLNDDKGLRGSSNQRIHFLSGKLSDYDFQTSPRKVEIHITNGEIFLVGVPTKEINTSFENSVQRFSR